MKTKTNWVVKELNKGKESHRWERTSLTKVMASLCRLLHGITSFSLVTQNKTYEVKRKE